MPTLTVGDLESALFAAFPKEDAEPWDNPGLAVGDRGAVVGKVAFNLDMSTAAIMAASDAGCNVLVTHHPAFIKDGPAELGPAGESSVSGPGRMLFEAVRRGVAAIAMHTNADRAVCVREEYARLLGMHCAGNFEHVVDPSRDAEDTGLGALLEPRGDDSAVTMQGGAPSLTLGELARRCRSAFGGAPRVWGDAERTVRRVAMLNGSASDADLHAICMSVGVDAVVVGERRYHLCLDSQPHLSVVEVGHDKSELAIVDVLERACADAGVEEGMRVRLSCAKENWWVAEKGGGQCQTSSF